MRRGARKADYTIVKIALSPQYPPLYNRGRAIISGMSDTCVCPATPARCKGVCFVAVMRCSVMWPSSVGAGPPPEAPSEEPAEGLQPHGAAGGQRFPLADGDFQPQPDPDHGRGTLAVLQAIEPPPHTPAGLALFHSNNTQLE